MTYRTGRSYAVEDEAYDEGDDEPRRGLLSWILIVALLIGTGSGSALLWHAFGGGPILSPFSSSTTSVTAAVKPSGQGDLTILRQEITGSIQSTQQLLAAQKAEIARLTEQVSALSSKLELLQRPVTSAQAAIPVPAPKVAAPAAKKKPEAPKPVAAKPAEAKPASGPISTGGTPLQLNR